MGRCLLVSFVAFVTLALLFFLIGIVGPVVLIGKLHSGIHDQVVIDSADSSSYDVWQKNTQKDAAPLWMEFSIFNVTNPEEVENGAIPNVTQIGPYSYREYSVFFNVSFGEDGAQRTFKKWEYFVWDPTKSFAGADPMTDEVTVVSAPFQAVLGGLLLGGERDDEWWKTLAFDMLAATSGNHTTLFRTLKVNDLIFGYNDSLLELVAELQPGVSPQFQLQVNVTSIEDADQTAKFTTVNTGKKEIKKINDYILFQGEKSNTCWGSEQANQIEGNSATGFWPGITVDDTPGVYVDNIFRSANLVANETVIVEGIKLIKFGVPPSTMLNATENPENAAYYQFGPSGVLNLTKCLNGAPIFVSKPHFLDAAPFYREQVNGMNPNRTRHDIDIDVEPTTGITMFAAKRLQLNVRLFKDMILYPNAREGLYIPLAWVAETGGITSELAKEFRNKVYGAETIAVAMRWVGIGVGVVFFSVTVLYGVIIFKRRRTRRGYFAIDDSTDVSS